MKEETKETQIAAVTGGYVPAAMQSIGKGEVLIPAEPLDIRSDCSNNGGTFSLFGDTTIFGNSLEFHIFDVMTQEGIIPSDKYSKPTNFTQFIGLVQLPSKKAVATVTFGSSSAEEARNLIPLLQVKAESSAIEFVVKMELTPMSNKKGQKYFMVKFSDRRASQEEISLAISAIETNPDVCSSFRPLVDISEKEVKA